MKTLFLGLSLLLSGLLFGQTPNLDTTKSVLLVSHTQSFNAHPFGLSKDIILFVNIKDKEIYGFVSAEYNLYGEIVDFTLDSAGHMNIIVNMSDRTKGKDIEYQTKICHTVGDDFFTMTNDGKTVKHTKIKCEFSKEKIFNVDFN
jgi:hypothetical protein